MQLAPGIRVGPYEALSTLGAGGMGEVYRARDTTLGREVALKVLPLAFAQDRDRLARFEREARALASLNYPNIAQIYGFEKADGIGAIVMELVEGPTLADRIARGALPLREALTIASQIAAALDAAHEQGIIHRDLKPSNIKIRPDGTVKVLDFGLAKLVEPVTTGADAAPAVSGHLTMTDAGATRPGLIVGTAAYMSPEQAAGKAVDRRTDIFAFGAVLYEMLTGQRPFQADSLAEVLGRVLEREADWNALPAGTPDRLRELLRRCLEKDPRQRRRDIGDVRAEIDQLLREPARPTGANVAPGRGWRLALLGMALLAAGALAAVLVRWQLGSPDGEMHFEITTAPTTDPASLAISPDGQTVAFVANADGRPRLWLRTMDSRSPQPLVGTDGAKYPFWSPDSRSLGFFADGRLKRVDRSTGDVRDLAAAPSGIGGTWNRDDLILFVPQLFSDSGDILSIAASGGNTAVITSGMRARFPQYLPDGRHFIFHSLKEDTGGILVAELGQPATTRLLRDVVRAVYAPPGQLLFVRKGTLFAQAFDATNLRLEGTAAAVAEQISIEPTTTAAAVSGAQGRIIYRTSTDDAERHFVWRDRSGGTIGTLGDAEADDLVPAIPSISRDGSALAVHRMGDGGNWDIWVAEIVNGTFQRFTSQMGFDGFPVLSRDANRIVFSSEREGGVGLYETTRSAGLGSERLLLKRSALILAPQDWSSDGRFLLYDTFDANPNNFNLWALPMASGDRTPIKVAATEFNETNARFSPDGKWVAYESDESGQIEIYLQPFPGPGRKRPVSANGGGQVAWTRNGRELTYIEPDGRLVAVPMRLAPDGSSFEKGPAVGLFSTGGATTFVRTTYAVTPDGERFLFNTITKPATSPISVVLNWKGAR